MKGIVFTEFIEMVEQTWSVDFASDLLDSCDLPSGGVYTAVGSYPHTEMVTLVVRLSELSGKSVPALLEAYGEYLFGRFTVLYPALLAPYRSALELVASIESVIHVEVRKLYPDAELPQFEVLDSSADHLEIQYRSERHLADLAQGLIRAAIRHYGEEGRVELERTDQPDEPLAPTCFLLKRQSR